MSIEPELDFEVSCPVCACRRGVLLPLSMLGARKTRCSRCAAVFFIGDSVVAELLLLRDEVSRRSSVMSLEN